MIDRLAWYDRRLVLAEKLDHVEAPDEARSVDEVRAAVLKRARDAGHGPTLVQMLRGERVGR